MAEGYRSQASLPKKAKKKLKTAKILKTDKKAKRRALKR
jgi:hypothetical protein